MKTWAKIDPYSTNYNFDRKVKNDAVNLDWKLLFRKGVPFTKAKSIILSIFGLNDVRLTGEYEAAKNAAFKGHDVQSFRNFPTFSEDAKIEHLMPHHCLTDTGICEMKRLMWVIRKTCGKIEYSPMIISIVSFLFIFFDEAYTYHIIKCLSDESYHMLTEAGQFNRAEELRSLRWWFHFNEEDFMKTCEAFIEFIPKKSKQTRLCLQKIESLGYKPIWFIKTLFENFF